MRLLGSDLAGRVWTFVLYLLVAAVVLGALAWSQPWNPKGEDVALETLGDDTVEAGIGPADFVTADDASQKFLNLARERVERRPGDWSYQDSLARALMQRFRLTGSFEDLAEAGRALDKAIGSAPNGSGPALTDAVYRQMVHRITDMDRGIALYDGFVVKNSPGDTAEITALKGDQAYYTGDMATAFSRYEEAREIANDPGTAFRIATWKRKAGDGQGALAEFARAAQLGDGKPSPRLLSSALLQSGVVELGRGNWDSARRYFVRANTVFPGFWLNEAHLAQMYALDGDMKRAASAYRSILDHAPQPVVMDALAALYRQMGDRERSQKWATRAANLWAQRLSLLPNAAYGHAVDHELVLGSPAKALVYARKDYAARPYGDTATMLAWALLANGEAQEAADLLEQLDGTQWQTAQQYAALSEAYAILSDSDGAEQARAQALELNPRIFDATASLLWFGHH